MMHLHHVIYFDVLLVFGKRLIDQPVIRNKLGSMVRYQKRNHAGYMADK